MTIITGSNSGVAFDTSAINETLIVAPGATAGALQTTFTGSLLINYGNLSGLNGGVAFDVTASGQFINKPGGSVEGALGVFIKGAGDVLNQGVILGATQHGISVQSSANHNHIVNSGDVYGFLGGITVSAGSAIDVSISNSGEIRADLNGIWLLNATGAAPVVVNSGTVIGRVNAILAEGGDRLNVTNSGLLSGDVVATSAGLSDLVANNGTVAGNVKLGTGNDFYHGSGTVSGTVFGEDGLDNLFGGKSADRLDGGSGNDHLGGGLGRDTLTGGANNDFFVFDTAPNTSANRDSVTDFNHANDTFQLDNAVFKALGGTGALKASFFFAGAAAHDADDHIIYNRATGVLTYDSNGNAAGGAVQFAVLTTLKPVLAANDFVVI